MLPSAFATNCFKVSADPSAIDALAPWGRDDAFAFHRAMPGYSPTPLVARGDVAECLDLGEVWVKDESKRFGLNAFKALGACYAAARVVQGELTERGDDRGLGPLFAAGVTPPDVVTLCAATAGNHGRAVAYAARTLGQRAVIYVPAGASSARVEAIRNEGADVRVVQGSYDDAVAACAHEAAADRWRVVSDMSWPGYEEVPGWIMAGYTTMLRELEGSLFPPDRPRIDLVMLQAGCGGLAAACAQWLVRRYGPSAPPMAVVEPTSAACCFASIRSPNGTLTSSDGREDSIMAGLNCGTPSLLAWPVLRATVDVFIAIDDDYTRLAMRLLADASGPIVAGEAGAAGLGGLLAIRDEAPRAVRDALRFGPAAQVLIINSEGATDPAAYRAIVAS